MRYKVVAIRDTAVDVFGIPNMVPALAAAIRSFSDECKRPHTDDRPNVLNQHKEDFELYHLGEYNDEDASFDLLLRPVQLMRGADVI